MPMKKIQIKEIELSYEDEGDGQPVVFVHGSISDCRMWNDHREIITPQFRMIAVTQRYFGLSPWSDDGRSFSIQTHADDLAAFIKVLRPGPVAIVGHSYGGAVSLAMAVSHPELVGRLFLYEGSQSTFVAASGAFSRAANKRLMFILAGKAAVDRGDTDAALEILMDGVNDHAGDFQRLPDSVRSMMQQNTRTLPLLFAMPPPPHISCDDLAKLKFPVNFVAGQHTHAFYKMVSKAGSQCLPGSTFIEVPSARHLWPSQNPAAFSRLVLDFLKNAECDTTG
jgi:pimeloyl-ACP methyl ester carboxylesterase